MKKETEEWLDYLIGGDITQTQNCNINVEQPNNNVIGSSDTETKQSNGQDQLPTKPFETNNKENVNKKGKINQRSNCNQKNEQPENNICDADSNTVQQANN